MQANLFSTDYLEVAMEMFEYQKEAVEFLRKTPRALLELDTGLGKTRVCIEFLKSEPEKYPIIICPKFLKETWRKEIKKWGYEGSYLLMSYSEFQKDNDNILNTELLLNLAALKPNTLILDEAHYLKSWKSKRTKNILLNLPAMLKSIVKTELTNIIFSTATPLTKSAADLHPLVSVCEPGKWGKFRDFCTRYCNKKWNKFKGYRGDWDYFGVNECNANELTERLKKFRMVLSLEEALKESPFPEKVVTDITLELEPVTLEASGIDKEEARRMILQGRSTDNIAVNRVALGLSKVPDLLEYMGLIAFTKLVIFTWHKDVAREIVNRLKAKSDMPVELITGDIKESVRGEILADFNDREYSILVATIASCGVGLNLQAANNVIFVELPWSYAEMKQAENRVYRVGQKKPVFIHRLIAKDSLDELVLDVLDEKEKSMNAIGSSL